jgi:hypothetical protein
MLFFLLKKKSLKKGENKLKELAIREGYVRNLVADSLAIFFFYFFDLIVLLFSLCFLGLQLVSGMFFKSSK